VRNIMMPKLKLQFHSLHSWHLKWCKLKIFVDEETGKECEHGNYLGYQNYINEDWSDSMLNLKTKK
jgi:hypothetical protein